MKIDFKLCANVPDQLDTIIVGAGPAGMTSAVYASRRKLKTLMICGKIGGQMNECNDIQNWTGVAKATGPELSKSFFEHVKKLDDDNSHFDLWLQEGVKVENITKKNGLFVVETNKGEIYKSKTVILTMGKRPRLLNIPGEKIALQGNGLSLSATSDAPLYKDKKMVVIGGGNSAMDVTLQLSKYTNDITIITENEELLGVTALKCRIEEHPNIKVITRANTEEILLDAKNKVRGVVYTQDGALKEVVCQGMFEEVGLVPASDCVQDLVELNERGEIIIDQNYNTSVAGCYAGGDINNGKYKQVIVAAGEGAVCALEAHSYILEN